MSPVRIEDIDNLNFWIKYFGCSYPNGYDEERDTSVTDIMLAWCTQETEDWWKKFTGCCPGVFDDRDGYADDPATLEAPVGNGKMLKIEFHPGDTLYYINGREIGSTGPHWKVQVLAFHEIEQLLAQENGRQLFLLLLPLAFLQEEDAGAACRKIKTQIGHYFPEETSESLARCIAAGSVEPCG